VFGDASAGGRMHGTARNQRTIAAAYVFLRSAVLSILRAQDSPLASGIGIGYPRRAVEKMNPAGTARAKTETTRAKSQR
jgi:hypothetical protein